MPEQVGVVSLKDVMQELLNRKLSGRWGDWKLTADRGALEYEPNGYYIEFYRMRTSAAVLDWIFQIEGKSWATPQVMADLLCAIRETVDPQATLCSGAA